MRSSSADFVLYSGRVGRGPRGVRQGGIGLTVSGRVGHVTDGRPAPSVANHWPSPIGNCLAVVFTCRARLNLRLCSFRVARIRCWYASAVSRRSLRQFVTYLHSIWETHASSIRRSGVGSSCTRSARSRTMAGVGGNTISPLGELPGWGASLAYLPGVGVSLNPLQRGD